jgi:hypothetical protein
MQRYLKKNSSQNLIFSGSVETTLEANLEKMALDRGGALSDYTIGIEDDDVVNGWWEAKNESNKTYADRRKAEYPAIGDQLDKIYHEGIDAWKADMIKPIKDKYPKE